MSVLELQRRHRDLFGQEPESTHRKFLFRKIAWHLQAKEEGCLPESVRDLARAIAQDVRFGTVWSTMPKNAALGCRCSRPRRRPSLRITTRGCRCRVE